MKVGANVLCLCSSVIGLVALLLPWWVTTSTSAVGLETTYERDITDMIRLIHLGAGSEMAFALGWYLFAVGVALCFWTPIGGVLQASGVTVYFVMGYTAVFGTEGRHTIVSDDPGLGAAMAVAAAVVAMVSLVYPVFIGADRGRGEPSRFLVWSITGRKHPEVDSDS